jgi:hypothetical protein
MSQSVVVTVTVKPEGIPRVILTVTDNRESNATGNRKAMGLTVRQKFVATYYMLILAANVRYFDELAFCSL